MALSVDGGCRNGRLLIQLFNFKNKKPHARDLTTGSVRGNLWYLSWPQISESVFSVADQLADLFWAGRLGFKAIAGLGIAQTYILMLMTARMGLDAGMRAMVARAIGAKDIRHANNVVIQSVNITFVWSIIIGGLGIVFAERLLNVIGVEDDVVALTSGYLKMQFVAMSLLSFQRLFGGALQAAGDSITPLKAITISRLIHLCLTPFLIFGWGVFPSMGLAGAGFANVVAQVFANILNIYALMSGRTDIKLKLSDYCVDFNLIWKILKVGIPAGITGMQRSLSQWVLLFFVVTFGTGPAAAFSLSRRAENIVNHASRGLGRAAGTLAAQNLGAQLIGRARSSMNWAIVYCLVLSLFCMVVFLGFPDEVAMFFSDEKEFVQHTTLWIFIMGLSAFPMSSVQVFTQGVASTGDTLAPMIITLSTMWVIEIPVAIGLALLTPLDSAGVAIGIAIGNVFRCVFFFLYVFSGKWLRPGIL